jgi:two-component system, OmpR family, sensor histidine kinase RstB
VSRLYLQVYLTIVGSLVLVVLTAGVLWHFFGNADSNSPFRIAGEVAAELVPEASASRELQQQAVSRLAGRLRADLGLFDASGMPVAAAGQPVPAPTRTSRAGRTGDRLGPVFSLHLADGRWLVARFAGPHRPRGPMVIGFLAAIALAVALGALPVVKRLTGRLERLQTGVQSLGAGDLGARVKVEGRDEVAELAKSFNQAAARIRALVDAHKMLLANASHELRTPLARIRLAIELAGTSFSRKAEIEGDIAELDRLVDEILLASRLDAIAHLEHPELADLLALAAEECARYEACAIEGTSVGVRGDPMLLRRLLRNLLDNAQQHGRPPVEVTVGRHDGRAVLRVRDHGPVIGEPDRECLFTPFYRVPGTTGSSTGLGLALVRQIARRHHGEVIYEAERGSCFMVSLPAQPLSPDRPAGRPAG